MDKMVCNGSGVHTPIRKAPWATFVGTAQPKDPKRYDNLTRQGAVSRTATGHSGLSIAACHPRGMNQTIPRR